MMEVPLFYASSDENAVLAQAFEEHRDNLRNLQSVFLIVCTNSEEMGKFSTASLITRTTNDITQVQMIVAMGLQAVIKAPILLVWAVIKISGKEWQWSLATGIAVLIILIVLMIAVVLLLLLMYVFY